MASTRAIRVWAVVAVLVAAVAVVALELTGSGPITHLWRKPSRAELDALLVEGDALVRALEHYHANHLRYPSDLPTSLDTSRGTKYGGWHYTCADDCTRFELFVGHYRDYSFEIHWRTDGKTWHVDT